MGRPFGQLELAKQLDKLREDLGEYYGAINMLRMGLHTKVPEKPAAVMIQDQIDTYNELPYEGGLMAQPATLMKELAIVVQVRTVFEASLPPPGAK